MLNLIELEQFVAFADYGTLSKAAEHLNISQPTITRSMQHVEDAFGVPLFIREKNRITLSPTGKKAVSCVRVLLATARDTVDQVQRYHKSLHSVTVESCAPAPLWTVLPELSSHYPDMSISSCIQNPDDILNHVIAHTCDIGILPYPVESKGILCTPILKEALSICVRPGHDLASMERLTFSDLNGFNFLLRSEIGFWDAMCRKTMPASIFLVQTDDFAFQELVYESTLPCFTTNLAADNSGMLQGRIVIPITDPEATVTYHLILSANKSNAFRGFLRKYSVLPY